MPFRLRSLLGVALVACLSFSALGAAPSWPLLHGRPDARVSSEHRWALTTDQIGRYLAGVEAHNRQLLLEAQGRQAAARAAAQAKLRESERPKPQAPQQAAEPAQRAEQGSGACGGDLPPCFVMRRESGGDIRVWNGGCYAPIGWQGSSPCGSSSASGKWQFVRRTWQSCGFPEVNAADAPEWEQDACARQVKIRQPGAWG